MTDRRLSSVFEAIAAQVLGWFSFGEQKGVNSGKR